MTSVLMIGHMPRWRDRRTSALLTGKGCEITWLCPAAGEPLPRDLSLFQAMVVLGGPQYVYNADEADHTYLADEMRAIERWLRTEKPFLGICLGAQLLAATLGAEVGQHPEGMTEIGYYPIRPTAAGKDFIPDPFPVYEWHYHGFAVPHGAELLASGDIFANQAFRYGSAAYGLQFHPDSTPEEIIEWTQLLEEQLSSPGAHPRSRQLQEIGLYDRELSAWFGSFLEGWLEPARNGGLLSKNVGATTY
jgi:GMP synthase (glutamine-hydrolysing)